jgi:two-component system LytT family response regulator
MVTYIRFKSLRITTLTSKEKMKQIRALIINDDIKILSSLKACLSKHCKSITAIYTSNSLISSEEVIKEKKPDLLLFNMNFVDFNSNSYLSTYLNSIRCEIIYFSTYTSDDANLVCLDNTISSTENCRKSTEQYLANNSYPGVCGFNSLQVKELIELINKAITLLLWEKEKVAQSKSTEIKRAKIIAIPSVDSIDLIEIDKLMYLEADGSYTVFYLLDGTTILSCRNIGDYETQLDPTVFFRIHHKYIVNIKTVKSINKASGNYCEIKNGKELPIAKRRQQLLYQFLNLK